MSVTKSVSFRQAVEEHHLLVRRAGELNLKPSVLVADVVHKWLTGQFTAPAEGPSAGPRPTTLPELDAGRLESLVCRAVWAVVVALSPTLDETAAAVAVNELMRPTHADWGAE